MWRWLPILSRAIRPFNFLYHRILERPLRAGGEIAACCGLVAGAYGIGDNLLRQPSRSYLTSNGYTLDTTGYAQAIARRDSPAVDSFWAAGVEPPSPAKLCEQYQGLDALEFLLAKHLIERREKCGSAVEGTTDQGAVESICKPWQRTCDQSDSSYLKRLARICETFPCPMFNALKAESARRMKALSSPNVAPLLASKGAFVSECLASRLENGDRRAQFGGSLRVSAVPVRYNYGYGGEPADMPASPESMDECLGAPYGPGYPGWIVPDNRTYGIGHCTPVPAEERQRRCEVEWGSVEEQLRALRAFDAALNG